MLAVGGLDAEAPLLAAAQAGGLHESGDAVAAMPAPLLAQGRDEARTAISLPALGVAVLNLQSQGLVGHGTRAGAGAPLVPGVVAAGGDVQIGAQGEDGVIVFHGLNPCMAFGDGSERMPNVFLTCRAARRSGRLHAGRRRVGSGVPPATRALPPPPSPQRRRGQRSVSRHKAGWL